MSLPVSSQLLPNALRLTDKTVKALALDPGKTDQIFFDCDVPGFGVRVRDGGNRSYIFQYKLGAKHRRIKIGLVSAMKAADAREQAETYHARVHLGEDPAGEKAAAVRRAVETFGAILPRYLAAKERTLRPKAYIAIKHHLEVHAKPLHELQAERVQLRDIAAVLTSIGDKSGAVIRNRVRTSLSGFFSWLMSEGIVDRNPVIGSVAVDEPRRDRVLSPPELRIVWKTLGEGQYGDIVRLLMLTGQRADEIAGLRRSEIRESEIVLPPERTKNGREHSVPLSAAARSIIDRQPLRANTDGTLRDPIFGFGEGGFSGWSRCKERLDAAITEASGGKPLPAWTIHDLRRTFTTQAAEIGILPHVIEAVLNHVSGHKGGVAGRYNHATYRNEKKAALDRWADQLLAWVEDRDTNITALRATA